LIRVTEMIAAVASDFGELDKLGDDFVNGWGQTRKGV
jgi:hypothetical protein